MDGTESAAEEEENDEEQSSEVGQGKVNTWKRRLGAFSG
jgi:hypothetical protein